MAESREREHWEYLKDRHETHVSRRNSLDDLAFKTSERYDHWVLTLSGGALAVSLTFIEKIAPQPASNTLFLLGLSWLTYIAALLAGFAAIYYSRCAIYDEIEIDAERYAEFTKTSKVENFLGEVAPARANRFSTGLSILNKLSLGCFIAGTVFLCCFAYANLPTGSDQKGLQTSPRIALPPSVLPVATNLAGTNRPPP